MTISGGEAYSAGRRRIGDTTRAGRLDWAVASVCLVIQMLAPQAGRPAHAEPSGWVWTQLALALAVGQALPIVWRRIHPFVVAAVVLASYGGYAVGFGPAVPLAAWVVIWTLATVVANRRRAMLAAAAAAAVTSALMAFAQLVRQQDGASALLSMATVIVLLTAVVVRTERSRLAAAGGFAAAEERLRIAGDMHDLVGHGLSTVAVQSSAARVALDAGDAVAARAAMVAVEATSRASLREVRQWVGVLRADASGTPPPGLADIAVLVENVRATGAVVTTQVQREAVDASAAVQLCAYRIVQEALTNAVKHAPGALVHVSVRSTARELVVAVSSSGGAATGDAVDSGGLGLTGLRTRVAALGGLVQIGPTADGWRVAAQLPLCAGDP